MMRRDDYEDSICLGLGIAFVIIIAFVLVLMLTGCGCDQQKTQPETQPEAEVRRFTGDGWGDFGTQNWEFSTITDTETGVVYLVFNTHNGRCSVGEITPLLQRDGSVTIDERYAEKG